MRNDAPAGPLLAESRPRLREPAPPAPPAFQVLRVSTWPTDRRPGMGLATRELGRDGRWATFQVAPAPEAGETPLAPEGPHLRLHFEAFHNPALPWDRGAGPRLAWAAAQRLRAMASFRRRVLRHAPWADLDLVHIHSPLYAGIAREARRRGIPAVLTVHGTDFHRLRSSRLLRRLLLPVDRILCVSDRFVEELRCLCPEIPVEAVYNGVDTETFRPGAERRKRILTAGTLRWQKDQACLIEAFARLTPWFPEWELWILGEGPLRAELEDRVRTLGLDGRVFLPGARSHGELARILGESAVFCLPSKTEGLPKALLEAMASGCACLATDTGECASVLGDSGRIVPPGDTEALRRGLEELLPSAGLRTRLGAAARRRAGDFSWPAYRDRHFRLYTSLLSHRR